MTLVNACLMYPKCLEGTRVDLLNHIYGLLENPDKSRLIWLHGMAGVGKSAVAFTKAERMRGLKVEEQTTREKRLAGTFFFLAQVHETLHGKISFCDACLPACQQFPRYPGRCQQSHPRQSRDSRLPHKSLQDQMKALFLQPFRGLRLRLRDRPPLVFVVDALNECISEDEIACLVPLLGQTLRDLPVIHILLTSRSEARS
jgi:hypothetical protein